MSKEFNLSDKISPMVIMNKTFYYLKEEDVKEFIRLLKEAIPNLRFPASTTHDERVHGVINKLSGKKLSDSLQGATHEASGSSQPSEGEKLVDNPKDNRRDGTEGVFPSPADIDKEKLSK